MVPLAVLPTYGTVLPASSDPSPSLWRSPCLGPATGCNAGPLDGVKELLPAALLLRDDEMGNAHPSCWVAGYY